MMKLKSQEKKKMRMAMMKMTMKPPMMMNDES